MCDVKRTTLLARMERAIALMAERIKEGETPSLDELAAAAAFSRFHFHRAYRLVTGETPAETQRRLRLARAVDRLGRDETSVTGAAMEVGYASSQALAKALQSVLAASASELRADPERLGAAFVELAEPLERSGGAPLKVSVARTPGFEVIVTRHVGPPEEVNGAYWTLFNALPDPSVIEAIVGFPHADEDFETPDMQVYDAAFQLSAFPAKLPEEIDRRAILPVSGLVARHVGSHDDLPAFADDLMRAALAAPGVEIADAPLMIHALDDPDEVAAEELRSDVYLPLKLA